MEKKFNKLARFFHVLFLFKDSNQQSLKKFLHSASPFRICTIFFIFYSSVRGLRACVYNCVEVVRRFVQIFRKTSPAILVTRVEKRRKNVDGAST